ncbi:MAG: ankyrin repeat domain-containing protein [Myxococcota bacterium]
MFATTQKLIIATALLGCCSAFGAMDPLDVAVGVNNSDTPPVNRPHAAAYSASLKEMQMLAQGELEIDMNHQSFGKITALHHAAEAGDLKTVMRLVQETVANADLEDCFGRKPLHAAAMGGRLHVVRWLIVEGYADLEQPDHHGYTALHWSAMQAEDRHIKLVQWLLNQGADPQSLEDLTEYFSNRYNNVSTLLQNRKYYVRRAKKAMYDALKPHNKQWEGLLPVLHQYLGWRSIECSMINSKDDKELQEALAKLTNKPNQCCKLSCALL